VGCAEVSTPTSAKLILKAIATDFAGKEVKILAIGKKSGEFLKRRGFDVVEYNNEVFDNLNFDGIAPIAERIMQGVCRRHV
jgi:F0F1-type ATP synthase gamma subunit